MSRLHPRQPDRMTGPPSPAEIIEVFPVPRVKMVVALRIDANANPIHTGLAAIEFTSKVLTADRGLRLAATPVTLPGNASELMLTFTPEQWRGDTTPRLEKVIGVVREAAAGFGEVLRADIVPLT